LRRLRAPRRCHEMRWERRKGGRKEADRLGPHGGERRRGLVVDGLRLRWAERARRAGGSTN
jgi:hypothetical protein